MFCFFLSGEPLFLTPYIETGRAAKGRELAKVTEPLFGFEKEDMVESYSGFLTVNKEMFSNLFFWFFTATVSSFLYLIKTKWQINYQALKSINAL